MCATANSAPPIVQVGWQCICEADRAAQKSSRRDAKVGERGQLLAAPASPPAGVLQVLEVEVGNDLPSELLRLRRVKFDYLSQAEVKSAVAGGASNFCKLLRDPRASESLREPVIQPKLNRPISSDLRSLTHGIELPRPG